MKGQLKYFILGFMSAIILVICIVVGSILYDAKMPMVYREQSLPSGRMLQVVSFSLRWDTGDHDMLNTSGDGFVLECIAPQKEPQIEEWEILAVFELIRPISEQWGFKTASIDVFPSTQRKGTHSVFVFRRSADGKWSFKKVYVNI